VSRVILRNSETMPISETGPTFSEISIPTSRVRFSDRNFESKSTTKGPHQEVANNKHTFSAFNRTQCNCYMREVFVDIPELGCGLPATRRLSTRGRIAEIRSAGSVAPMVWE
jgi:hypothetical protein